MFVIPPTVRLSVEPMLPEFLDSTKIDHSFTGYILHCVQRTRFTLNRLISQSLELQFITIRAENQSSICPSLQQPSHASLIASYSSEMCVNLPNWSLRNGYNTAEVSPLLANAVIFLNTFPYDFCQQKEPSIMSPVPFSRNLQHPWPINQSIIFQ